MTVFQADSLLFVDVYLIEIGFLMVVVSVEIDLLVVEHYYTIEIVTTVDCYWLEIVTGMIVDLVLVEMLAFDLNEEFYRH